MAAMTTITELKTMQLHDLRKEILTQENTVLKLRIGVTLGKEKDSARYIRERKQLARMKTVYTETTQKTQRTEANQKMDKSKSSESSESSASSKKTKITSSKSPKKK